MAEIPISRYLQFLGVNPGGVPSGGTGPSFNPNAMQAFNERNQGRFMYNSSEDAPRQGGDPFNTRGGGAAYDWLMRFMDKVRAEQEERDRQTKIKKAGERDKKWRERNEERPPPSTGAAKEGYGRDSMLDRLTEKLPGMFEQWGKQGREQWWDRDKQPPYAGPPGAGAPGTGGAPHTAHQGGPRAAGGPAAAPGGGYTDQLGVGRYLGQGGPPQELAKVGDEKQRRLLDNQKAAKAASRKAYYVKLGNRLFHAGLGIMAAGEAVPGSKQGPSFLGAIGKGTTRGLRESRRVEAAEASAGFAQQKLALKATQARQTMLLRLATQQNTAEYRRLSGKISTGNLIARIRSDMRSIEKDVRESIEYQTATPAKRKAILDERLKSSRDAIKQYQGTDYRRSLQKQAAGGSRTFRDPITVTQGRLKYGKGRPPGG